MKKSMLIVTVLIVIGIVIIVTGILLGEFLICIVGGVPIALSPIFLEIKKKTSGKSIIDFIDKDERPILSTRKDSSDIEEEERWKKLKMFFEKIIIMLVVAGVALGLIFVIMQNYFLKPTYISIETAVSEGCAILHRSSCRADPSEITVNYDVNGDKTVGGAGDTLSELLGSFNCTGSCIKTRCACAV